MKQVSQSLITTPAAIQPFPFSDESNSLLIKQHFEPILGPSVWDHVQKFGIEKLN